MPELYSEKMRVKWIQLDKGWNHLQHTRIAVYGF